MGSWKEYSLDASDCGGPHVMFSKTYISGGVVFFEYQFEFDTMADHCDNNNHHDHHGHDHHHHHHEHHHPSTPAPSGDKDRDYAEANKTFFDAKALEQPDPRWVEMGRK